METADFSDTPVGRSSGVLIEGCTFKGGGFANTYYKNTLNFEMPLNVVVRNNTFLRGTGGWGYVLNVTDRGNTAYTGSGAVFTGNVFDLDTDSGIPTVDAYPIAFKGTGNQFTGNTIRCHYGSTPMVTLDGASGNVVSGNTFLGRGGVLQINGASGNTISPNVVQ